MNYSFTVPASLVFECSILVHDSLLVKCELRLNHHCNLNVQVTCVCVSLCP